MNKGNQSPEVSGNSQVDGIIIPFELPKVRGRDEGLLLYLDDSGLDVFLEDELDRALSNWRD